MSQPSPAAQPSATNAATATSPPASPITSGDGPGSAGAGSAGAGSDGNGASDEPAAGPAPSQPSQESAAPAMADDAPPADAPAIDGRIYWLDIGQNGVYSALPDGSEKMHIADALAAPDGVAVDECTGDVYFTNMGSALGNSGRASVQRARWDGSEVVTLVPPGSGVNTAKQLTLDVDNGHAYFADREGVKIWRMNLDGSELTQLLSDHGLAQLVGVAVDADAGTLYFSAKNSGRVLRMGLALPQGQSAADRTDVETLAQTSGQPIDLALDREGGYLYFTDRSLGTVTRIEVDRTGFDPAQRADAAVLMDGLSQPIGISLDLEHGRLYVTEAGGTVHRADLDGTHDSVIAKTSSATGIDFARIGKSGEHPTCP